MHVNYYDFAGINFISCTIKIEFLQISKKEKCCYFKNYVAL